MDDPVLPVTKILPEESTATLMSLSKELPPRKVAHPKVPEPLKRATKKSDRPLGVVSNAPGVAGKSLDVVVPATEMLPIGSTAKDDPVSFELPPRNVDHSKVPPPAAIFVMKTSLPPFAVVSKAPEIVGKSVEDVPPVTKTLPAESTASDDA